MLLRVKIAIALQLVFGATAVLYNSLTNLEADERIFLHEVLSERDGGRAASETTVGVIWSSIAAAFALGAFSGSFLIHTLTDSLGRRNALMRVQNVLLILGAIVQFCARPSRLFELLFVGRLICGAAFAVTTFLPTFLAECLAKKHHGTVAIMMSLTTATLIGIGALLPELFATSDWHYTFLIPIIPSSIHFLLSFWFPDSPKHIYMQKFDEIGAQRSLRFYRGADFDWEEQKNHMDAERLLDTSASASLLHILKTPVLRSPFFLVIATNMLSTCGGIDIAYQYSTTLMVNSLHIDVNIASVFSSLLLNIVCGTTAVIIGSFFEKRLGRRQFVLAGGAICVLSSTLISIIDVCPSGLQQVIGVAGLIMTTMGFYGAMLFSLSGILAAELCPYISRSKTVGVSVGVGLLLAINVIVFFAPLHRRFGSLATLPLSATASALWLFLYRNLPETKGRSLEDIAQRWINDETQPIITDDNRNYGTKP